MPCTPSASIVFTSAWIPAPPPESEPAMARTRGGVLFIRASLWRDQPASGRWHINRYQSPQPPKLEMSVFTPLFGSARKRQPAPSSRHPAGHPGVPVPITMILASSVAELADDDHGAGEPVTTTPPEPSECHCAHMMSWIVAPGSENFS